MAKIKLNAEYFRHDSDMRNDDKIKAVRNRFSHEGYAIWNMMLEKLADADNFKLEFTELNIELWGGDFDSKPEKVKEIIEFFVRLDLLQKEGDLIFSQKQITRFEDLMKKRNRDRTRISSKRKENDDSGKTEKTGDNKNVASDITPSDTNVAGEMGQIRLDKIRGDNNIVLSKDNTTNSDELSSNSDSNEKINIENSEMQTSSVETEAPPPTPSQKKVKGKTKAKTKKTDPPAKGFGDPEINKLINLIKKYNNGIVDGTLKKQRNFGKNLLDKLKKLESVKDGKYTWEFTLELILKNISQNSFHCHKIAGPEILYRNLGGLMQVIKKNKSSKKDVGNNYKGFDGEQDDECIKNLGITVVEG